MREFLFRGKRIDNGEWVIGDLVHRTQFYGIPDDCYFILTDGEFHADFYYSAEVDCKTIGQYTGLTDKNGKKIFEGDILSVNIRESIVECGARRYTGRKIKTLWTVEYGERNAQGNGFYVFGLNRRFSLGLTRSVLYNAEPEVIGNIHDNPELFKKDDER